MFLMKLRGILFLLVISLFLISLVQATDSNVESVDLGLSFDRSNTYPFGDIEGTVVAKSCCSEEIVDLEGVGIYYYLNGMEDKKKWVLFNEKLYFSVNQQLSSVSDYSKTISIPLGEESSGDYQVCVEAFENDLEIKNTAKCFDAKVNDYFGFGSNSLQDPLYSLNTHSFKGVLTVASSVPNPYALDVPITLIMDIEGKTFIINENLIPTPLTIQGSEFVQGSTTYEYDLPESLFDAGRTYCVRPRILFKENYVDQVIEYTSCLNVELLQVEESENLEYTSEEIASPEQFQDESAQNILVADLEDSGEENILVTVDEDNSLVRNSREQEREIPWSVILASVFFLIIVLVSVYFFKKSKK